MYERTTADDSARHDIVGRKCIVITCAFVRQCHVLQCHALHCRPPLSYPQLSFLAFPASPISGAVRLAVLLLLQLVLKLLQLRLTLQTVVFLRLELLQLTPLLRRQHVRQQLRLLISRHSAIGGVVVLSCDAIQYNTIQQQVPCVLDLLTVGPKVYEARVSYEPATRIARRCTALPMLLPRALRLGQTCKSSSSSSS